LHVANLVENPAPVAGFPTAEELRQLSLRALAQCGADVSTLTGALCPTTPITGTSLHAVPASTPGDVDAAVRRASEAFEVWRTTPAPSRGALLKRFGQLLEEHIDDIATLITLEAGKVPAEARGEVHEMIEMCDVALGLSRQLNGRTMPSQRPGFRLMESWHPLGVVTVISPFSFPAAVWSWSAPVALVCGNPVIWKPSEQAPLTALACGSLLDRAAAETGAPAGVSQVLTGAADTGRWLAEHSGVALVNASGTTETGRAIAPTVAARFGRSVLQLSGNNASVITPSADLDLAAQGILAAATAAAGQRCTTMRRLIAHHSVADAVLERVVTAYGTLKIGSPLAPETRVGPLINHAAYEAMTQACEEAQREGGRLVTGGERLLADAAPNAFYVQPAVVEMPNQDGVVQRETVAPVLYVLRYDTLNEAIALNNGVRQGFTSSIYTRDQAEMERFLAADGSDCGIVNVNMHTSGAEVGTAFGGEKETGGGRQCGSDVWRTYVRRVTSSIG
jgi:aldehyde dehydrogenase (NAD+)